MYKKSEKLKLIRRGLEDAQCLGVAIRNAGIKSDYTVALWRKRLLIERYIRKCMDKSDRRRVDAVVDSLFKQALTGNVGAIAFYLKNKAGWRDVLIDQSQHAHFISVNVKELEGKSIDELVKTAIGRINGNSQDNQRKFNIQN